MSTRITYEYIKRFIEIESGSNGELLTKESDYTKVADKIEIKCSCGEIFETSFVKFEKRNKRQCNRCSSDKLSSERRLDYSYVKNFIDYESKSGCKLLSTNYKNTDDKLKIQCKCGNEFEANFYNFKNHNSRQCKSCRRIQKQQHTKPHTSFCLCVEENFPNEYEFITEYKNAKTKIKFKCKTCNKEFESYPHNFLKSKGCPYCNNSIYYTTDLFKEKITDLVGDEYTLIGEYDKYVTLKHNKCGYEYKILSNSFVVGNRCPRCKSSKGEKQIEKHMLSNKMCFSPQYRIKGCKNKRELPFDFAVFEDKDKTKLKCLIEYDGEFHYKPVLFNGNENKANKRFETTQRHDEIKNKYCKDNDILLIRIPYWEFNNVEQIINKELAF